MLVIYILVVTLNESNCCSVFDSADILLNSLFNISFKMLKNMFQIPKTFSAKHANI